MAKNSQQKIDELNKRKAQIEALIQKEKAKARTEERKQDTRRKIIAGALALEHASIDPTFGEQLHRLLDKYVTRPQDRALFDLPPPSDETP